VPRSLETVIRALQHRPVKGLPRGELFLYRDFLDGYFNRYRGDYLKQLAAAAERLDLSLVGIELNNKTSPVVINENNCQVLETFYTVGCLDGPVSGLIAEVGFLKAMVSTKNNPALFSGIAAEWVGLTEKMVEQAKTSGLRAIAVADDIAGNQGLFFSTTYFQDEVWPIYKTIVEIIKGKGLSAFFHSDGDIRKIIPLLIEGGFDCLHPVDTPAGMDLYELKRDFGDKITFMGHVDLLSWTWDQVHRNIILAEKVFSAGGLVLGSAGGLSLKTVNENIEILYPDWKSV
jgi:Uroporphyrinogen decarboxylase (URO-D)